MNPEAVRPLRIAMVCDPISDYIAGIFVSTWRFARMLRDRGHTIIFIAASSPEHPTDSMDRGFMMYRFSSILLPKTEKAWRIAWPGRKRIRAILRKEQIDVVHLLLPMPSSFIVAHVAHAMGIPVIAHSHAQPENAFLHLPIPSLRAPLNRGFDAYMGRLYSHADMIVFPTVFAQKCLEKHLKEQPFKVISNGVDREVYSPVRYALPARAPASALPAKKLFDQHGIPDDAYVALFVGRLHPEKNIKTLINAMVPVRATLPNAHAVIIGGGHMDKELRLLAQEYGVADRVHFFGKVSDSDVLACYQSCHVFVLPSLAELEGMAVLEAMSCGMPLLIADAAQSASRFFVQENGYVFSPFDHAGLARRIIELSDPALQRKMSKQSRELSKQYDVNESLRSLENAYYEVIGRLAI